MVNWARWLWFKGKSGGRRLCDIWELLVHVIKIHVLPNELLVWYNAEITDILVIFCSGFMFYFSSTMTFMLSAFTFFKIMFFLFVMKLWLQSSDVFCWFGVLKTWKSTLCQLILHWNCFYVQNSDISNALFWFCPVLSVIYFTWKLYIIPQIDLVYR